jgi:hypothetical protein
MSAVLGAHDRISSEMLVKWQGREIARSDGFFLLYEWVHDGVAYAHDYHRSLASLTPRNSARAELHIGLVHSRKNPPSQISVGAKEIDFFDGLAI